MHDSIEYNLLGKELPAVLVDEIERLAQQGIEWLSVSARDSRVGTDDEGDKL